MTGPEHYREAEQLLTRAYTADSDHAAHLVASAQTHATLALAAATAVDPANLPGWRTERHGWDNAVGGAATQWVCDGCGDAMTTAPGGRVPDPPVCDTCWRVSTRDTRKTA